MIQASRRRRVSPNIIFAPILASAIIACGLPRDRAIADTYPSNKITIIVAFAAGGVADTVGRLIGQNVGERLKQTVVIENRGGAGGNIAASTVARATPDGYTLLVTTTALAINETLRETKSFSVNDFVPIAIVASSPESLITSASNPAASLSDLLKAAQGRPITYGSAGVGSGSHIQAEYFFREIAKVPATHVPFQGGAPALSATLGGQIDVLATTLGGAPASQIKSGALKGLAIAAESRATVVPNVPTYAEQGFTGLTASSWVGVFAPAKTDPAIVKTLNAAIIDAVNSADVRQKLVALGFDPMAGSPDAARAIFEGEVSKWGKMVRTLNLSIK